VSADRTKLAEALRAEFEAALPDLISRALKRLDPTPPARNRADHQRLGSLLQVARDSAPNLTDALQLPLSDLRAVALALGEPWASSFRRRKDEVEMRSELASEILRRAHRYDAFHPRGELPDEDPT
jgi:hypothetical protein